MPNWNTALEGAGSWFLYSGIQEPDGGVARYYRSDTGRNAPVSTEITGYAASFLVYLHERTEKAEYRDAAVRAARYLTGVWDAAAGLFPFEAPRGGSDRLAYFFDSGIIVRGLLAVWRATGEQEYLDLAASAGHGMMANFLSTVFTHPIVSLADRRAIAYQPRWSASPGCYQLKSAMAWSDLFDVTGHADFWNAYEVSVARALADDAQFLPGPGDEFQTMDRLHAYLYFLEGLLPLASRQDCFTALAGGIERVAEHLRRIEPVFVRSDVYAQLLRVRLFVNELEIVPLDEEAAAYEAGQAAGFQFESGGAACQGGFGFGRKGGEQMPFVNPVSTAFCAQALAMWQDRLEGKPYAALNVLV